MSGMDMMSDAVKPLAEIPEFTSLMTTFSNPILGVLFGAVFTAVIQSSSASVGILQALALTGSITYGMAIPIIMGQNIGTCITALMSSIGVNRSAKRVAVIHVSFNLIGTLVCLVLFYGGNLIFNFTFLEDVIGAGGIAICHSIFNIFTTILLLPFSRQLEKLARRLVKVEEQDQKVAFLDPVLLRTPGIAVGECETMTNQMGKLAHQNLLLALEQLEEYSEEREAQIAETEDKLDVYEDHLSRYLVEISRRGVSMENICTVSRLLHAIGDFERIGDHALNIQESARTLCERQEQFSKAANDELKVLILALRDTMEKAFNCFYVDDATQAREVEPMEETIDRLIEEIRLRHIRRLQSGECTMELGFVLSDLLTNYERVSDHCSNVALSVIEEHDEKLARHEYLNNLKDAKSFNKRLNKDLAKYTLPDA